VLLSIDFRATTSYIITYCQYLPFIYMSLLH